MLTGNMNVEQMEGTLNAEGQPEESNSVHTTLQTNASITTWEHLFLHVLKYVLKHMDVKRVKICRLVSKKWNDEACKDIRNRTVSSIVNNSVNGCRNSHTYCEFSKLIQPRNELPLPFKFFDLDAKTNNHEEFFRGVENILQETERRVRSSMVRKLAVGATSLSRVDTVLYPNLQKFCETLTYLVIDNGYYCKLPAKKADLQFPSLESLTFGIAKPTEGTTKDLFVEVIKGAPQLKRVTVHTDRRTNPRNLPTNDVLSELMILPNFTRIRSFCVYVFSTIGVKNLINGLNLLKNFISLEIRGRKALELPDKVTKDLLGAVEKFSRSIQYLDFGNLQMNPSIVSMEFPFCPCLESLSLKLQPGYEPFEKMPTLKRFGFREKFPVSEGVLGNVQFHETVEALDIDDDIKELTPLGFSYLQKKFPNCKKISMHASLACRYFEATFKNQSLAAGWKKLNNLALYGHATTDNNKIIKLLRTREQENDFLNHGSRAEMDNEISVENTWGITTLLLDWYYIDKNIVTFLGQIKSLEILSIRWSRHLDVGTFKRNLSYLKEIFVTNCCDRKYTKDMGKLFSKLRSVRCGCKLDAQKSVLAFGS